LVRESLFVNAGYLLAVEWFNYVAGFVFWALAARLYLPEDIGMAAACIAAVTLVSALASLGVDFGIIRFLPGSPEPARLLNSILLFHLLLITLAGGVYYAGARVWSPSLHSLASSGFLAHFMVYAWVMGLERVLRMAFIARKQSRYVLFYTTLLNLIRLMLLPLFSPLGALGIVRAVLLATGVSSLAGLALLLKRVLPHYRLGAGASWPVVAAVLPFSSGNYLSELLRQLPRNLFPLIVLEVLGAASNGYAYVAWMIGGVLASPGLALGTSAFAEGSNQLSGGEPQQPVWRKSVVAGLAVTVPVAAVTLLSAPWLLRVFSPSYAGATAMLRWMALFTPVFVCIGLYFAWLRTRARITRLIVLSGLSALVTVGLGAALLSHLGLTALGIGFAAGNGVTALVILLTDFKSGAWFGLWKTTHGAPS
jgi:O-antigen/teichoic acid export membrane protein